MCGIVGIASTTPSSRTQILTDGRDTMSHRGPDSSGEWWSADKKVGMGHRRLSIIDLSETASQPMKNAKGNLSIVFNGEIYNYQDLQKELQSKGIQFRTHSDTEVILAAYELWGIDCLSRFNGTFAFGLFDSQTGCLLLARDRVGEKPLFYAISNNELRFASEMKALLADPQFGRKLDVTSLNTFLAQGFVNGQRTIIDGVNKLPAAHAMLFNVSSGHVRVWRYWQLPEFETVDRVDETQLLQELELLLEDSVRRQLTADVPVGVLLSGGTDSSLVTAMAARSRAKIMTFTVKFPEFPAYDESRFAQHIAKTFDTDHYELEAHAGSVDLLPKLASQFDEPIIDSSMIPTYLVCQLIREHCIVALGGDGGDELFGGYRHYNRLLWLQEKTAYIPRVIRRPLVKAFENQLPIGHKGRNWIKALGSDFRQNVPLIASYFDLFFRKKLIGDRAEEVKVNLLPDYGKHQMDLLQRATRTDFHNYLTEDILVKVDRASMLNSLEVRAPMLDYRLIEFAFRKVPTQLKTNSKSRKIILKKLAGRVLPQDFDASRKQGFSVPLSHWLKQKSWSDFFKDVLLDGAQTLFDHQLIEQMMKDQAGHNNGERLFGLLTFELWRKEYKITL